MKKIVIIVFSVLMVFIFSATAYASTTFFSKNKLDFHIVGQGTLSGQNCYGEFTATALPGTSVQPDEMYSSRISILLYDTNNVLRGNIGTNGNLTAHISHTETDFTLYSTYSTFYFEGSRIGGYSLYN